MCIINFAPVLSILLGKSNPFTGHKKIIFLMKIEKYSLTGRGIIKTVKKSRAYRAGVFSIDSNLNFALSSILNSILNSSHSSILNFIFNTLLNSMINLNSPFPSHFNSPFDSQSNSQFSFLEYTIHSPFSIS